MISNSEVWIVDDDPIALFIAQNQLKKKTKQLEIKSYKNGVDAINALSDLLKTTCKLPKVILLDMEMPILDGWGFLNQLANFPDVAGIRIVILSSSTDSLVLEQAVNSNQVVAFFPKPFNQTCLETIVSLTS